MNRQQTLQTRKAAKPVLAERFVVTRLALFGSAARGEARPDSDIDLLIEFEPGEGAFPMVRSGAAGCVLPPVRGATRGHGAT